MSGPKCPPINGVVETCLYVGDLKWAVIFYQSVLGLTPMTGNPDRFNRSMPGQKKCSCRFFMEPRWKQSLPQAEIFRCALAAVRCILPWQLCRMIWKLGEAIFKPMR